MECEEGERLSATVMGLPTTATAQSQRDETPRLWSRETYRNTPVLFNPRPSFASHKQALPFRQTPFAFASTQETFPCFRSKAAITTFSRALFLLPASGPAPAQRPPPAQPPPGPTVGRPRPAHNRAPRYLSLFLVSPLSSSVSFLAYAAQNQGRRSRRRACRSGSVGPFFSFSAGGGVTIVGHSVVPSMWSLLATAMARRTQFFRSHFVLRRSDKRIRRVRALFREVRGGKRRPFFCLTFAGR